MGNSAHWNRQGSQARRRGTSKKSLFVVGRAVPACGSSWSKALELWLPCGTEPERRLLPVLKTSGGDALAGREPLVLADPRAKAAFIHSTSVYGALNAGPVLGDWSCIDCPLSSQT